MTHLCVCSCTSVTVTQSLHDTDKVYLILSHMASAHKHRRANEWRNITNADVSTQVHCMGQLSHAVMLCGMLFVSRWNEEKIQVTLKEGILLGHG